MVHYFGLPEMIISFELSHPNKKYSTRKYRPARTLQVKRDSFYSQRECAITGRGKCET